MNFKFTVLSLTLALVAVNAGAQNRRVSRGSGDVVDRAYATAERLERRVGRLNPTEIKQIEASLERINSLLGGGGRRDDSELVCVSRDNDNSNPYMLGYRPDPITVIRLPGTVMGSKEACENARTNVRELDMDRNLTCVTRDNDGSNPWMLAIIDSQARTATKIVGTAAANYAACTTTMMEAREVRRQGLGMCVSRDNDGSNPYVVAILSPEGNLARGNEVHANYTECMKHL
jgi:hypothetical protein